MSDDIHTFNRSTSVKEEMVDITEDVRRAVTSCGVTEGVCFVHVPHTTAAVTINENADPDVRTDIIKGMKIIVPEDIGYQHAEGNSPAHIKSSMVGNSVTVFISGGRLVLGTWQGIYFCEFDGPRTRRVEVKIIKG